MAENQVRRVGGWERGGVRTVDTPAEPAKKPARKPARKRASKPKADPAPVAEVAPADPFFDVPPPEAA